MGFNIDISKLSGEWKQWAEQADAKGTNDKFINSVIEVDDVITQALEAGKDAKEIASVMSGKAPEEVSSSVQPDKSRAKTLKKDVFAKVDTTVFNGNWDDVASNLTASMISQTQSLEVRIYYSQLAQQVRVVTNAFKNYPCNSRADVNALEDKVKKELNIADNDEFKDFKLDLIDEFVEKARTHQKQVEQDRLTSKYNKLIEEGKTREQAMNALQTADEFKGSYYHDYGLHRGLIHHMDDGLPMEQARDEVWDAIEKQRGKGLTDGKDIENAVVAQLKEEGKYDKYAKRVLRGELSLGEKLKWDRSLVKAFRKSVAADNRAAEAKAKHWTENEIRDEFKKKNQAAFAGLISNEVTITNTDAKGHATQTKGTLITEKTDENGNIYYDISNLSDLIRRRIGADLLANRQKGDLSSYAEIENIRQEISAACGVDISKKDAKHLIKLCGYDVESKNWAQIFYAAFVDTAVDGISALGGMLLTKPTATASAVANVTTTVFANAVATYIGPTSGTATFDYNKTIPFSVDYENDQDWSLTINYGEGGSVNITSLRRQLSLQKFADGTSLADYLNIQQTENGIVLTFNRAQGGSVTVLKHLTETLTKVVTLEELGIDPNQYDIVINTDYENDVDTQVDSEGHFDVASALLKTMLFSFALNVLREALREQGELPTATTQFNETDLQQYLAKLSKNGKVSPALLQGLSMLAMSFVEMKDGKPVEGGKWDSEAYKRVINNMAGDESFFNKYEAAIGTYTANRNKPEPEPESESEPETAPRSPVVEIEKKKEVNPATHYTPGTTTFTAWQDLVNGYECLKDPRYNVAVKSNKGSSVMLNNRMVKILQALDLSKVPEGVDVKEVYNIDLIADFARVCIEKGIDAALADEKFKNLPVDKAKYQELLSASGGVKGDVVIPDLYDSEGKKTEWKENGRVHIVRGNDGATVTVDISTKTVNGNTVYYARPKGNPSAEWKKITERQYRGEDPIVF